MACPLANLLNPMEDVLEPDAQLVDIAPLLRRIASLSTSGSSITVPVAVERRLADVLCDLEQHLGPSPSANTRDVVESDQWEAETNVRLTSKTTLETLYHHPLGTLVEYLISGRRRPVGHMFRMDPADWVVPDPNIAYSRAHPMGRNEESKPYFCDLMVDGNGNKVPCFNTHSTCRGVKVCPFADIPVLSEPHTAASRASIQSRLRHDRDTRMSKAGTDRRVFETTAAYITALRKHGCHRPLVEATHFTEEEEREREIHAAYLNMVRRGQPASASCQGRLRFIEDANGNSSVQCEHYHKKDRPDHYSHPNIGHSSGQYDLNYIRAVLEDDCDLIKGIEEAANDSGWGPLTTCKTVCNFSTQKANCACDHRDEAGKLTQPLLTLLPCKVRFHIIEPYDDYREACPFVLITSHGEHPHPIPLASKTPVAVRRDLFELMGNLGDDLADLTPRRLLRNPIVKAFLKAKFPRMMQPTLIDLHPSLANHSHLKAYIRQIQGVHFPHGTGWNAVVQLKILQDTKLQPCDHYIRYIHEVDANTLETHEEDDDPLNPADPKLRIIVCMSMEGSRRMLSHGAFLQSDISFKRITDFYEFEVACMDRDANTSLTLCRVYLNRQTAVAHKLVFQAFEWIVFQDTGKRVLWRHLHAASRTESPRHMILQWGTDQHRGQAKGLGLHLQSVAASMGDKRDLHEPHRRLKDLDCYEHLHRVLRLCSNHFLRNIKACAVSDEVKVLMRSLLCISHPNWDGTLAMIRQKGGKAGQDWLRDKETTGFALQGICHAKSMIPLDIWKAGDPTTNLVESVHKNVNEDGVHCTLLGGLQKGQAYDSLKFRTLQARILCAFTFEDAGIRPTYKTGHLFENAFANMRKRDTAQRKRLLAVDQKIDTFNAKLKRTYEAYGRARHRYAARVESNWQKYDISKDLQKLAASSDKALQQYRKLLDDAEELIQTQRGTGRVVLQKFDLSLCDGRVFDN
ncbi:hypothetical protein C8F01DRAFT_1285136 [Mycena amicta]|nr:hypothetical protein C8F01DRAFT_1285136 [Mycena amicta]